MKRKRIIAALLTGIMLCSSIPMNIQASDLDAVFDDGGAAAEGNTPDTEGNISATEDEINTDGTDVNNSNMDDISDENMETPDVFTDEMDSATVQMKNLRILLMQSLKKLFPRKLRMRYTMPFGMGIIIKYTTLQ